jgi:hypothetical protein
MKQHCTLIVLTLLLSSIIPLYIYSNSGFFSPQVLGNISSVHFTSEACSLQKMSSFPFCQRHFQNIVDLLSSEISHINLSAQFADTCRHKRRIALYGSSHTRVVFFNLMQLLRHVKLTEEEREIPSLNVPAGKLVCDNVDNQSFKLSCIQAINEKASSTLADVCRYRVDVGTRPEVCGFPSVAQWTQGKAGSWFNRQAPADKFLLRATESDDGMSVLFAFKSWTKTPKSDATVLRLIQDFNPHVLVLGLTLWGSQYESGERDSPGVNLTYDEIMRIAQEEIEFEVHHVDSLFHDSTVILHTLETSPMYIQHANRANWVKEAVTHLPSQSRSRHLLLEEQTILDKLPANETQLHGYEGLATLTWANAILSLLRDDITTGFRS